MTGLRVFLLIVAGLGLGMIVALAAGLIVRPPSVSADLGVSSTLAPHRATYDIRLLSVRNGAQIINVAGQMTYSWEASCEGWVTNHGFKIAYEYAENPPLQVTSQFSTLESLDGQSMRFASTRWNNGEVVEALRGQASLGQHGKNGVARYDLPTGTTLDLPPDTVFPMTHTLQILQQAKTGIPFLSRPLFDGSDVEGVTQVSAVIGKGQMLDMAKKRPDWPRAWPAALQGWNLNLAFFPVKGDEGGEADYDLTAQLLENGVMTEMTIAYKDFKVHHVLTKLESLPIVKCSNAQPKAPAK